MTSSDSESVLSVAAGCASRLLRPRTMADGTSPAGAAVGAGDEDLRPGYIFTKFSLRALETTQKLESPIAAAQNIGLRLNPVSESRTPDASGIQNIGLRLNPVSESRTPDASGIPQTL